VSDEDIVVPLKKLAGETTRDTRPIWWTYRDGSLVYDKTPHGYIVLGSNSNIRAPHGGPAIELGGDPDRARMRPNVNIVPGATVDILHDLNNPFPMESDTYDLVYSAFVIEHIKNSRIKQFISECYRITKPGGASVHIGPNLRAQCASMASIEKWTYHEINTIFAGGEDPSKDDPLEGYHHSGMDPQLAVEMFKEAGFSEVVVWEYPKFLLEMVIEAWK
jgi:predicted SAM-dependent methyltransferase